MQKELNDVRPVLGKMIFPIADVLEPFFPNVLVVQRFVRQLLKL